MSRKVKGMSAAMSRHNLRRMTEKKGKPSKNTMRGGFVPDWEKRKR